MDMSIHFLVLESMESLVIVVKLAMGMADVRCVSGGDYDSS